MRSGPGGKFPINVDTCYTIQCQRVGDRSGGYSTFSMEPYRGRRRLEGDRDVDERCFFLFWSINSLSFSNIYILLHLECTLSFTWV